MDRGDDFRKAFSKLGTLRSIIPNNVKVMALTATATKETFSCIEQRLSMQNTKVIGLNPNRPNIKYIVKSAVKVNDFCNDIVKELLELCNAARKTVIFCQTLAQCAEIFLQLKRMLGPSITEPPGVPVTIIKFRLIDLFTSGSTTDMREAIVEEFC